MKNMRIKTGNWLYVPNNETVKFVGKEYSGYEVDLERKTCAEWLHHLTGKAWIKTQDLKDLWSVLQEIKEIKADLPIFTNTFEKWFAFGYADKPIETFLIKEDSEEEPGMKALWTLED